MKRKLFAMGKAVLSLALIAWILRTLDADALAAVLREFAPTSLALAAVLIALQAGVIAWRWHRIVTLLGGRLPASNAVRWVFLGMFFNNALPTAVGGDAVRIWLLRQSGAPLGLSIGSVAIERGTGIVLLGLLITACMPAVWATMRDPVLRLVLASIGPLLFAGLIAAAFADKLAARWIPTHAAQALKWLGNGLRRFAAHPRSLLEIVLLGILGSLTGLLAAYVLGENLGIDLGPPAYIVLVGGAVLLSVLPISLGGWGVRELGMVALFGSVGVGTERALALSLVWGLLPLVVSLPAGLVWWLGGTAAQHTDKGAGDSQLPPSRRPNPPR